MAKDLTRNGNFNQLKHISCLSFNLTDKELAKSEVCTLAKLPKDAVITGTSLIPHTVSSASSITADVKIGSTTVLNDVDLTSSTTTVDTKVLQTKGLDLTIQPNKKATDVNMTLILTMVEPNRTTGEYLVMKNK